jgi:hypothetical protein
VTRNNACEASAPKAAGGKALSIRHISLGEREMESGEREGEGEGEGEKGVRERVGAG